MNRNVKVLMLGWELPPHNSGGLGVACLGLTRGLSSLGVKIAFALPRPIDTGIDFMEILPFTLTGVNFYAINSRLVAYQSSKEYELSFKNRWKNNYDHSGNCIYDEAFRFADLAAKWAETVDHTVIHGHDWMTYPASFAANRKSKKPVILHVHATEYDRTGGSVDPRIAEVEYTYLNKADRVVAVSNYTKNIIHNRYTVPMDHIEVVHNGIEPWENELANIKRNFPFDKVVLYVGRLTYQKGVDYFLESARLALQENPNTVFLVVGSGDMERHLIMRAAFLGIGDRVVFCGYASGEKLQRIYAMSDLFVMPSVSEPFGIVAMEAAISGVPVIVSKTSGVAETLKNVECVDFWDTHQMAKMIGNHLRFPKVYKEKAEMLKKEALAMSWIKSGNKMAEIYRSVI